MACYSVFSRFYDLFTDTVDYSARAAYFDALLRREQPDRGLLLDLACGTGSLSVELSQLGYEVIGVDASEQMLSLARQKSDAVGENILFLHQRMETLDLYGTVDACVCALDSLNHLSGLGALTRAIRRVALFLAPNGILIFDLNSVFKHQEILADNCFVYERDQTLCVWQNRTEGLKTEILLDFFSEGADGRYDRCSERLVERAFERVDVERIVAECGLSLEAVYGDDSFDSPAADAQRWIFVTKKGNATNGTTDSCHHKGRGSTGNGD